MPKPAVIQNPEMGFQLQRGFDKMARVLAVTLGPHQGTVLVAPNTGSKVELLNDAATIARRIIQLPDRGEDVGAMLLRQAVWQLHEKVGDGAAMTAVLAQAILQEANRAAAAGANPMRVRTGVERATTVALKALRAMARPLGDEDEISRLAESMVSEPNLSLVLGEIFDLLGPEAHVQLEDYAAPYLERDYIEGGAWKAQIASRHFVNDAPTRTGILNNCFVLLYHGTLRQFEQIQPALELVAAQEENKRLCVLAHRVEDEALHGLVTNHQQDTIKILAAGLSSTGEARRFDLEDIAVLTRATLFSDEMGRFPADAKLADLGIARRVEADPERLTLVSARHNMSAVRARIATLRQRITHLNETERNPDPGPLEQRIARLAGQIVVLKIGASTKAEQATLRERAEKALRALPLGVRSGVVPGGGVAFLNCIPAVQAIDAQGDEATGVNILARALAMPFRQLLLNAGHPSPGLVQEALKEAGPRAGYDLRQNAVVDFDQVGVLDAVGVLEQVLSVAVSCAVMAFTTEVLVLHRKPVENLSLQP